MCLTIEMNVEAELGGPPLLASSSVLRTEPSKSGDFVSVALEPLVGPQPHFETELLVEPQPRPQICRHSRRWLC